MDYDLIVVKTLERVYKNYYYIIRGEHIMADSVAQVYMIGVMCIMAFFAVSCLIGVGKAKKRKEQENTK